MPHFRARRSVLAPIVVAALLGACAAACTSDPSVSGSADASPSAPSQPAAASPIPVNDLADAGAGQLAPGRYTMGGFSPAVTFELDGPWFAEQSFAGFFDVQQDVGSSDAIAVQLARPSHVFGADGQRVAVANAAEAAAALTEHPSLGILGESPGTTGGHVGHVVEVEHAGDGAADVSIMSVPPGPLMISPDRRLWISFIDTSDGLLAILVGGSVARWEETLATAEPVLESVTIED